MANLHRFRGKIFCPKIFGVCIIARAGALGKWPISQNFPTPPCPWGWQSWIAVVRRRGARMPPRHPLYRRHVIVSRIFRTIRFVSRSPSCGRKMGRAWMPSRLLRPLIVGIPATRRTRRMTAEGRGAIIRLSRRIWRGIVTRRMRRLIPRIKTDCTALLRRRCPV